LGTPVFKQVVFDINDADGQSDLYSIQGYYPAFNPPLASKVGQFFLDSYLGTDPTYSINNFNIGALLPTDPANNPKQIRVQVTDQWGLTSAEVAKTLNPSLIHRLRR
jgi:hypothetical protein